MKSVLAAQCAAYRAKQHLNAISWPCLLECIGTGRLDHDVYVVNIKIHTKACTLNVPHTNNVICAVFREAHAKWYTGAERETSPKN